MSRRNHLHDEMRWSAVDMLQAGARQSAVARELNVHRSVIHRLCNHYHRDQNASRRLVSGRRRITTTANDRYLLQCARRRRTLTGLTLTGVAALCCCRKVHVPPNCVAQTAEDCSHDDLLFLCFCLQPTSKRGCIGPVNIAVGHHSSGATYSLRMSLDLTSRTIPEGESQGLSGAKDTITEVAGYLSGQG
ncbi:hypothetical protein AVEN_54653-2 [Araneus ventricosus]|nr:hypothetical protein AVEN_54653-2 [Araneus ventricosus]